MKDEKVDIKKDVENDEESSKYFSLSPRSDLDLEDILNFKQYEDKLDWALKNSEKEDIKNIAITGYYGSGKSSVLKTFIKNYHSPNPDKEKYKFLELSLATFHDDKEGSDKVKDIEKSLLQQIFYKVEDNKIPHSGFSKITNKENFNFFEQGLICIIILLVLVRLYNLLFSIQPFFGFYWLDLLLLISVLCIVLLKIKLINKVSFKKLRYKNLEVEIEKDKSELSILSRFLDEIIYFFKETNYNVVVIEDIDRFESTEIFSNLRELNLILNNSELIREQIVFIYAIKNEQFNTASDRTKFFDFIIPVIPVVNYETSANEFKRKLAESDINTEWLDENMINSLFYLEDNIRVINNTYNELITYYNILNKQGGFNKDIESKTSSLNLLIPILFYKNVDPHDFSCLLKRKGYLYKVINSEEQIKNKHISILTREINDIKKAIEKANAKAISDIDEIKILVLSILQNIASENLNLATSSIVFNSVDHNNADNIFDDLIQERKIIAKNQNNSRLDTIINISKVEEKLNFKIDERVKHISNKNSANQLLEQIESIELSIQKIKNQSLAQIINPKDITEILHREAEKKQYIKPSKNFEKDKTNFALIETLILNDYINKDYFLYLSDYTKLGMSINDYKILISIKNKNNIGFEKKIDDSSSILKRISPSDYNSNAVLNFDLVDYILENPITKYPERIDYLFDWISKFSEQSKEFIIAYSRRDYNENLFFKHLSAKSKKLWFCIMDGTKFENHRDNLYKLIIHNAPKERLLDYCKNSDFSAYIEVDSLHVYHIDKHNLKFLLENLNEDIKLKRINIEGSKTNIDYIFNSNSYEINLHNIDSFINFYGINVEDYKSKLITVINQHEALVEMRNYIYKIDKLEPFIKNIILQNPANTKEEESIVLEILNIPNKNVSLDTKKSLFKKQEVTIENITEVEDSTLRLFILKTQRMESHPDNILSFSKTITNIETAKERNEAIEDVVNYIINHDNSLNLSDKTQRSNLQALIELCLPANSLEKSIYRNFIALIVKKLPRNDFNFIPVKNLKHDKFKILIEESYLDLTNENISFIIEEGHQELLPMYFEKHQKKLIEFFNMHLSSIKHEMGEAILEAEIDDTIKTQLVNLFFDNAKKFFEYTKYRELIYEHLLKTDGSNFSNLLLQEIGKRTFAYEHIANIFNIISPYLNKSQIQYFFANQSDKEYSKLAKHKKQPSFEINDANKLMLDKLLNEGIITGYKKNLSKNLFRVKYVNQY